MKILSIIIPTYNMSMYIRSCIESLLIDKMEDLDIIVVNDGSTDDSSAIAHEYAGRFPDSIRVLDKDNGNYGSCINVGLEIAKGKYVKILDADDTFDINVFAFYVQKLREIDVDLVLNDCCIVSSAGKVLKKVKFDKLIDGEDSLIENSLCNFPYRSIMMHNVAYRTQLIKECDYHQTEGISYTDDEWIFLPMIHVEKLLYFAHPLYHYLVGRSGQTVDDINIERNIHHIAKIVKRMANEYSSSLPLLSSFAKKYLEERLISKSYFLYDRHIWDMNYTTTFDLQTFDKELKEESPIVYDLLGTQSIKIIGGLSLHYIKIWREQGERSKILKFIRMIRYYKKKIRLWRK